MKHFTLIAGGLLALGLSGCATKEYVHEYVDGQVSPLSGQVKTLDGQVKGLDGQMRGLDGRVSATEAGVRDAAGGVGSLGTRLNGMDSRVGAAEVRLEGVEALLRDHDGRLIAVSATARDAMDRAMAAGKLAEGKFVYEATYSDATTLAFKLEGDELSAPTKAALDAFAEKLKSENKNVFIEIQGHTDTTGSSSHNLKLGAERAEAVRRYLNMKGGIALHRMSTISYGEVAPVADNKTRAGREKNRRVVLVVLK